MATLLLAAVPFAAAATPQIDRARKLYSFTDFEESLKILQAIPEKDAAVYDLTGRNYYMLGDYRKATDALGKAFAMAPENSSYALWLGRAYGRRAETSSMITAPGYASKARRYFEEAVELNPRNLEALSDLLEYYLEAPGFLGGGLDKAQATATKIAAIDPAEGHWSLAKIAEKRKEYASAEDQYRRAVQASPQQVGRLIDLARYLARQGRYQEADQNIARAEKIAPNSPRLKYVKADLYVRQKKNLDVARDLLKQYLNSPLTPDDPPRADAEKLLRQAEGG